DNSSFAFTSAPMGLSTSCGLLTLVMRKHLAPVLGKCAITYADDVLVVSPLWSQKFGYHQHTNDTDRVLRCLQRANLKIHPGKVALARFEITFLGHLLMGAGITRADKHIKALETYPSPTTVKELKQWMGLVNYFVTHIRNKGELFVPLCTLLKKDVVFNWTRECEEAMREINEILTS
ncbi:MAG: hypothetical protein GY702_05335, partial [Desulfobulbaceae bacterium]|nr:hypothetical protein [Desulfobulbaceae bacterium]